MKSIKNEQLINNYKEITPSNILNGQWGAVMDYVCTHRPVKIVSKYRPSVMIVHAVDYEDMKAELSDKLSRIAELEKAITSTIGWIDSTNALREEDNGEALRELINVINKES